MSIYYVLCADMIKISRNVLVYKEKHGFCLFMKFKLLRTSDGVQAHKNTFSFSFFLRQGIAM